MIKVVKIFFSFKMLAIRKLEKKVLIHKIKKELNTIELKNMLNNF
jgi:hypothetical protein